jgi:ATP-binding cassette, subfamily C, bacterial CydC
VVPHAERALVLSNGSSHSGGIPLSGGKRRRLLLARAVLTPGDVVLLDEPAEHLDPAAAGAPGGRRPRPGPVFGDRAVVVVTHRLSALDAAAEVLVVASGGISARGTHAELLRLASGRGEAPYRRAWLAEQPLAAGR